MKTLSFTKSECAYIIGLLLQDKEGAEYGVQMLECGDADEGLEAQQSISDLRLCKSVLRKLQGGK